MYDTLESMDCLGEMNTDNLEKMILRLPKWAQTKFREHLKNLERQGRVMPTFKDVVNFLNDRADVANHPFFSNPVSEVKTPNSKTPAPKFTSLATEGATDQAENVNAVKSDKKTGKCPMCTRSHPLYRCETFKSKPVDERHEFIKRNRICFNCINSVEHSSRSCKSSVRCQKPECGKRHHTLLHFSSSNPERNSAHQANHIENTATRHVPVARPSQDDPPAPPSDCTTTTMARPSKVLVQIVPLKVIGNSRHYLRPNWFWLWCDYHRPFPGGLCKASPFLSSTRSTYKKGPVATPTSSCHPWSREKQSVCSHWYKRAGSLHPSRSQERRAERAIRNKILPRMEYPWRFYQVQQERPVQSQPCLVWRDFFESPSRRLLASWILPHRKAFFKVDVCGGS